MYKKTPLFLSYSSRTIWSNFDQGASTSKFILDVIMLWYNYSLYLLKVTRPKKSTSQTKQLTKLKHYENF